MAYLGEGIPKLGFGLMRLPELEKDGTKAIDMEQLKQMVDLFLEGGFTYFDTAFGYHGGRSETAIKEALVDRYPRESFQLATKLPAWQAKSAQEAKDMLTTSLERTGAGYFDFYLLHNLGDGRTKAFDDYGIYDYLAEKREQGVIKHLGFSMHDKADALAAVLEAHPEFEFVQLQINYADWESPSVESRKCYEVARSYGKPVVVMEPIKGGAMAQLPASVAAVFEEAGSKDSPASWALRFAASLEGLVTVLSGMSTLEQVRENVALMKDFRPLDDAEYAVIEKARAAFDKIPSIPCTDCRYCVKGCPEHIGIPGILGAYNTYLVYGDLERAKGSYMWASMQAKASDCIECGACVEACPQHIEIPEELKRVAADLEG